MEVTMKSASLAVVLGFVVACGHPNQTDPAATGAPTETTAQLSLEQILADSDTGRDPANVRAALEKVLADPAISKEDRIRADMALARVVEPTDKERAVSILEDAVSLGDEGAQKRLFSLLSGHDAPSPYRQRDDTPVAPIAFAFARSFPAATPDREVEIDVLTFGTPRDRSAEALGTLEIGSALRQNAVDACGLCDEVKTSIHTHRSNERLWSAIPHYSGRIDKALVVVYVDQETVLPERYAKWLAAPLADVNASLARGEGLVAVKERPGAPPLVTLAAPRASQLLTVESTLAQMKELPKEPVPVKLASGLSKEEVRSGVQARWSGFKACYEGLLQKQPKAAGAAEIAFTITATGEVADARVSLDPALEEPAHRACFDKVVASLRYPAWSKDPSAKTTVRYPIHFSP
jgi:hypothetical protein